MLLLSKHMFQAATSGRSRSSIIARDCILQEQRWNVTYWEQSMMQEKQIYWKNFRQILSAFPDYLEEVQRTSLEKLKRERESIQRLQELTGLSQHSMFFRKRRAQSVYKSIKQRKPVELIQIEEEDPTPDDPKETGRAKRRRAMTEILRQARGTDDQRTTSARNLSYRRRHNTMNKQRDKSEPLTSRSPKKSRSLLIQPEPIPIDDPRVEIPPPQKDKIVSQKSRSPQKVVSTPTRRYNELARLNHLESDIQRQITIDSRPQSGRVDQKNGLDQIEQNLKNILQVLKKTKQKKLRKIEFRITKPEPIRPLLQFKTYSHEEEDDFLLQQD